jgi:hypothetical protein
VSFWSRFDHERLPFSVVVEDDEKVAYAYLLHDDAIVGDVWLYNCGPAPVEPEWRDRQKAPFANPRAFVVKREAKPIVDDKQLSVSWTDKKGVIDQVKLYFGKRLLAILAPGAKPGWCMNALKDGPLAKILKKE